MGHQHVVKPGECLSSIARVYGFANYRTIYDHPKNAALKQQRRSPDLLFPGDRLFIPDKGVRQETGATESRHRFVVERSIARLELAIRFDGEPLRSAAYTLVIESQVFHGRTDSDGVLHEKIDPAALQGRLLIKDPPLEWKLRFGHLDPVSEMTGIQARLNNLDHPSGEVDGKLGPRTKAALRQFQSRHGLRPTGAVDAVTRDAIRKAHDGA